MYQERPREIISKSSFFSLFYEAKGIYLESWNVRTRLDIDENPSYVCMTEVCLLCSRDIELCEFCVKNNVFLHVSEPGVLENYKGVHLYK